MYLYLDEAGDTGFRFKQGSSQIFVISLVIIEDDPTALDQAIERIRTQLHLKPRHEFKFVESNDRLKRRFFQVIQEHNFYVRAVVIDKVKIRERMTSEELRNPTQWFYNYGVKQVLKDDEGIINKATLVVDKRLSGRASQRAFNVDLQRELNSRTRQRLNGIKHKDSARENLLQVADMMAGAVYRRYEKQDSTYFKLITEKIRNCQGDILRL